MKILVSACLMGLNCRYNGRCVENEAVLRLATRHTLIPFCPEIYGGLPTPREGAERLNDRVITKSGLDVTAQYERGAKEGLRLARQVGCQCALLQERSPSCGHEMIHDGHFTGALVPGEGVLAGLLLAHGIQVYSSAQASCLLAPEEGDCAVGRPQIFSLRAHPELADEFIAYFQSHWASEQSKMVYEDCMRRSLETDGPLPEWYMLKVGEHIVGGAGLIANDFISRMDLYPWICAVFVEPEDRGHAYGSLLLRRAREAAWLGGFPFAYLCTDHIGYYERYGFEFIGMGYHPWGDSSRIYRAPSLAPQPNGKV